MNRLGYLLIFSSCAVIAWLAPARRLLAAEKQAVVQGITDRTLKAAIERAIGDEKTAPDSRLEARRRTRAATESARALLRSEGYYDYVITPDIGEGDHPHPVLTIDPGPRSLLKPAQITWIGDPPAADIAAAAVKAIALKPGEPARAVDIVAAEGRALAAIQQKGYADAKTLPRKVVVDHAAKTVAPTFEIKAASLVKLGSIRVDSKGRTRAGWIEKLVPWKKGAVYNPKDVAELERRLLDTHVYDSVTVALAPTASPDGLRPVVVSVSDRSRNTLGVEAGYSSTEGGDIDLKLSQYNRFGLGDTLTYEARYGAIDSRLGVEWALPHFWKPGQTLTTDAAFFQTVTNAYRETGFQLIADLTQRFGKTTYFTRGASITASQVEDFQTGVINIVTFRTLGAFALDESDNPLDPRHGFKLDARVEPTFITEDETLGYLKTQGQFSAYFPLDVPANNVIATRLHVGAIIGGNIPGVPASDRFYAGGGGSVRGYEYQSVGPHYADNIPVGGLSLVEATAELRHQFTEALGGVLFVDTGSVSEQVAPDFRRTLTAVGVGVRYNLGFAPLRADVAFPLQQASSESQQAFQIYLSIGQSF